jgi:hypothetical protein
VIPARYAHDRQIAGAIKGEAAIGRSSKRREQMSATFLTDLAVESDPGLPAFFLGRLASLATRQAASSSPMERAALGTAIFSIYLDCLDLGLGAEAHAIIGQLRQESGEPLRA